MKHILIITYYYPPYTGIEGNRLHSWAKALYSAGHKVTVLSRQWQPGGQNTWNDYTREYAEKGEPMIEEVSDNFKVVRLPYRWTDSFRQYQGSKLAGVRYWLDKVAGRFHVETDAYNSLLSYAIDFVHKLKPDMFIVSSPPLNLIRLATELKKATGVPYLADFRDSFNNYKLNPNFKATFKQQIESYFFRKYLTKWLRTADGISSVSEPVIDTIGKNIGPPTVIVSNGFENGLFDNITGPEKNDKFLLTVTGNLYPEQDIEFVGKGIADFIKKRKPRDFVAQFIGLRDNLAVADVLRKYIPSEHLLLTPRKPRQDALKAMKESQVLLQAGYRGYKGFCPGKVFEYMASGRNILIAPADHGLTDEVVAQTQTGYSASSVSEMSQYLSSKYSEWEANGRLAYAGKREAIIEYSREVQNQKLLSFVRSIVENT